MTSLILKGYHTIRAGWFGVYGVSYRVSRQSFEHCCFLGFDCCLKSSKQHPIRSRGTSVVVINRVNLDRPNSLLPWLPLQAMSMPALRRPRPRSRGYRQFSYFRRTALNHMDHHNIQSYAWVSPERKTLRGCHLNPTERNQQENYVQASKGRPTLSVFATLVVIYHA